MNKIFVANTKANLSMNEIGDYIYQLNNNIDKFRKIIICPSYIYIPFFVSEKFELGSQDISLYDNGAYTGDVTAQQLKSAGVKYSIIGHSERREYHKESDSIINKKLKKALNNNIVPILCIGETKEEKLMMKTNSILRRKILDDLSDIEKEDLEKIIIAYEPIWAIGTGITPTNKEAEDISGYIKDIVKTAFKVDIKVLYGGSVNLKNIKHFKNMEKTDGFLIGGASLNPLEFIKLMEELD